MERIREIWTEACRVLTSDVSDLAARLWPNIEDVQAYREPEEAVRSRRRVLPASNLRATRTPYLSVVVDSKR